MINYSRFCRGETWIGFTEGAAPLGGGCRAASRRGGVGMGAKHPIGSRVTGAAVLGGSDNATIPYRATRPWMHPSSYLDASSTHLIDLSLIRPYEADFLVSSVSVNSVHKWWKMPQLAG
ncbi:hypothetical protein GWI33_019600 [Rhynchophorus ferrugineus]|uniref:Uncharacterized protein n=1 Tax=Rhynchophorus ferrugineus TaxID=354439 RepID=A0A834M175_RHYFE|nr:hypothetical protein GWI33_019600 [Rhynchophorus ferrugineus]